MPSPPCSEQARRIGFIETSTLCDRDAFWLDLGPDVAGQEEGNDDTTRQVAENTEKIFGNTLQESFFP